MNPKISKRTGKKVYNVSTYVHEEEFNKIQAIAKDQDRTVSWILKKAIEKYLKDQI
jgi:predicted transcriptional regulator